MCSPASCRRSASSLLPSPRSNFCCRRHRRPNCWTSSQHRCWCRANLLLSNRRPWNRSVPSYRLLCHRSVFARTQCEWASPRSLRTCTRRATPALRSAHPQHCRSRQKSTSAFRAVCRLLSSPQSRCHNCRTPAESPFLGCRLGAARRRASSDLRLLSSLRPTRALACRRCPCPGSRRCPSRARRRSNLWRGRRSNRHRGLPSSRPRWSRGWPSNRRPSWSTTSNRRHDLYCRHPWNRLSELSASRS
mmetsp:Transcript_66270/g.184555  ORF Transcript_66270/g.184555 Transcript_66270/m.184555 type:complete len:247 (-) Transcript_66270:339-1079(-)